MCPTTGSRSFLFGIVLILVAYGDRQSSSNEALESAALFSPLGDHHQHLFSPTATGMSSRLDPVNANDLIRLLDDAGIAQATVLSLGYQYANPNRPAIDDEYEQVKAENDWTSREIAPFANRLRGFCGFNPLKDYALEEITRCAMDPYLRFGIKLHFGNSDVDLENRQHVERLQRVFRAANQHKMAIIIHMRPSVTMRRPYGANQARIFLNDVLPAAPDVVVQIAHLSGAGGYDDPSIDQALSVFVEAIRREDPRVARVYFDVSGIAGLGRWRSRAELVARRIREIGVDRVLFGSDGAVPGNRPSEAWEAFMRLPLNEAEFTTIANNIAPYLR